MIASVLTSLLDAVKIIIPIAVSAVIGNYLIQRWQQRNWRQQQLLLRGEKELQALKSAIDDLMSLADTRSYRSRRLLLKMQLDQTTSPSKMSIDEHVKAEYVQSVIVWNEKLNSLCVRLTMYAPQHCAQFLENDIQPQFVSVSERIEGLLQSSDVSKLHVSREKNELIVRLNKLNGSLSELCKELIRRLKSREQINYLGHQILFTKSTCEQFSTWQLVKALFKPHKLSLTVFGPPQNFSSPSFWGDE
jgi:hypothetical protein